MGIPVGADERVVPVQADQARPVTDLELDPALRPGAEAVRLGLPHDRLKRLDLVGGWAVQIPCRSSSRSRLSGWFVKLVRCTFVLRVARATSGFGFHIP